MKWTQSTKALIGVPVAIWMTLKVHVSWEAIIATLYVAGRFVLFVVPTLVLGYIGRLLRSKKKKRK